MGGAGPKSDAAEGEEGGKSWVWEMKAAMAARVSGGEGGEVAEIGRVLLDERPATGEGGSGEAVRAGGEVISETGRFPLRGGEEGPEARRRRGEGAGWGVEEGRLVGVSGERRENRLVVGNRPAGAAGRVGSP